MVLDLLKQRSDDAYYTEEHVLFLLCKMRSLLIERKYKGSMRSAVSEFSDENKQTIELLLEPVDVLRTGCGGRWLCSTTTVPALIAKYGVSVTAGHELLHSNVTFVRKQQMPYCGYGRCTRDFMYASRGSDGKLYLKSNNPQFMFLEKVSLNAVFTNPQEVFGEDMDFMEEPFPIEDDLITSCIEMVYQELSGAVYAPEDRINNAKDDMGDIAQKPKVTSAAAPNADTNYKEIEE